jgi:hypothetical protein
VRWRFVDEEQAADGFDIDKFIAGDAPNPEPKEFDIDAFIGGVPETAKALAETPGVPIDAEAQASSATASAEGTSEQPTFSFLPQSAAQIENEDAKIAREAGPLVTIPKAEITPDQSTLGKGARAAYNTVAGFVEGMTSVDGLVSIINPVVGVATMGAAVPELINKVREAEKTPPNSPERWQAGTDVLGLLSLPAVVHAAARGRGARAADEPAQPADAPDAPLRPADEAIPTDRPPAGETAPAAPERGPLGARDGEAPPDAVAPDVARPSDTVVDPVASGPDAAVTRTASEVAPLPEARATEVPPQGSGRALESVSPETAAGEPFGFGPGAASAGERLATYELRRFGERFQEDARIAPEIREATGNRYYEPIPNKVTVAEAAEIVQRRGTDESIRLIRDEAAPLEPRVRAVMAQGLIQKLNQSYAEAKAAKDDPRATEFLNQAVDTAEFLSEYGTRMGQGVQSFAVWSRMTPEGMLVAAQRTAKKADIDLSPEQTTEIARLTADVSTAAEGMPKHEAMGRLSKYMVDQVGLPAKDLPISIYYGNILSGVNTHVVNAVDTALNVAHEVNNVALSNPRAAAQIYAGMIRGFGEGRYNALVALQEGRRISGGKFIDAPDILEVSKFGTKGGVPIAVTGKASAAMKRVAESPIAKPLNAYKYVMRMMSASDSVMFRAAEEAKAGLLAHRMAEARGVDRAKVRAEADSILGYDRLPEFREQAAREGYSGVKQEARATELMIQSRPETLRAESADFAGVTTYNHEPRGMLGFFASEMARATNQYPALKLFVPFTRIVANVTNRGLDNTPVGFIRALSKNGKEGRLTGDAKRQALARATAGTIAMAGIGLLSAKGVLTLHGAGPSNRDKRRQLQDAGWKPYSIQVGDNYFTYTYLPIGLGLSVMANYSDSQRYRELAQKDALTRTAYAMSQIGSTIFNQSFLSGMSRLFDILSGDPGKTVGSLKNFLASTASGATTPNLLRDVNHLFDPVARRSDNIAQDMVRNIPVVRLSMKPVLNAFGEEIKVSRNRFYSSKSDDPAWRLVVEKNLRVPVADQTTFQSPDDGYDYAAESGRRMKQYVLRNMKALRAAKEDDAQQMLTVASRSIFDATRDKIIGRGGSRRSKKRQQ